MTYTEFTALSESEQLKIVVDGYSIATREDGGNIVLLNKVHDFFVEVYYNMEDTTVVSIKAIESCAIMQLYWQLVSINEVKRFL